MRDGSHQDQERRTNVQASPYRLVAIAAIAGCTAPSFEVAPPVDASTTVAPDVSRGSAGASGAPSSEASVEASSSADASQGLAGAVGFGGSDSGVAGTAAAVVDVAEVGPDVVDTGLPEAPVIIMDTGTEATPDAPADVSCECLQGPCCDGCRFRQFPSGCGERVWQSSCLADGRIRMDYRFLFCSGRDADCTEWGTSTTKSVHSPCPVVCAVVSGIAVCT